MAKTGHLYNYLTDQTMVVPNHLLPVYDRVSSLGSSNNQWAKVYSETLYENGVSLANKYMSSLVKKYSSLSALPSSGTSG